MEPKLTTEQVEEIMDAAEQFHMAMATAITEAVLKVDKDQLKALARELDKVKRDQENIAIKEFADKFGVRTIDVHRAWSKYVPF
jgi:hypothetical protein